jgi:hypothetical protein
MSGGRTGGTGWIGRTENLVLSVLPAPPILPFLPTKTGLS